MKRASIIALLLAGLAWAEVHAEEVMVIENVRIRGDQELPLVLHIVPWQPPATYQLEAGQQANAVLRPIEPLERESFQRLVGYHERFLNTQVDEPITP